MVFSLLYNLVVIDLRKSHICSAVVFTFANQKASTYYIYSYTHLGCYVIRPIDSKLLVF